MAREPYPLQWPPAWKRTPAETLSIVKTRYRNMIKFAHPDAGGTAERAAELNVAMADAEAELA